MPPPDNGYTDFDDLGLEQRQQRMRDLELQQRAHELILQRNADMLARAAAQTQATEGFTENALATAINDIQQMVQGQRIQAPRTPTEQEQRDLMRRWYQNVTVPWANYTQTPRGQQRMASNGKVPNWSKESVLGKYNKFDIFIQLSDIRRLLLAIHKGDENTQVRVKNKAPPLPAIDASVLAYNARIKYDLVYDPEQGINEINKVYNDPVIVWQKFDSWTNVWTDVSETDILEESKKRWLMWLDKWVKFKSGGATTEIKAPVWDYFSFVVNQIATKRQTAFANMDRSFQDRKFWLKFAQVMGQPDGHEVLANTYHCMRTTLANAGTSVTRNLHRRYRLDAPKGFRHPLRLNQHDAIEVFKTLYKIKYGTEWNKSIWHGLHSGQIEIEESPFEELEQIGGVRIPSRYTENGLVRRCDCCDELRSYEHTFILHPEMPEHKPSIEYLATIKKNKDKKEVVEIEPREDKKDINPLFALRPSNKTTEYSREVFINSFLGAEKKNTKGSDVISIPYWNYATSNWLPVKELKKNFLLCHTCQSKHWKNKTRFTRTYGENELPMWGRDYIRNYTDNPIKYHPPRSTPTKSSFNVGPKENRDLRETTEQVVVDTINETVILANGTLGVKRKPVIKDVKRLRDRTLYMGVELEVTPSESLRKKIAAKLGVTYVKGTGNNLAQYDVGYTSSIVERFLNHNGVGIMKTDASVFGGFEIVTVPGTLAWHKEVAWNEFFKENYSDPEEAKIAPSAFLTGWSNNGGATPCGNYDMPVCGIHIHVSKEALTPLQLGKIINFVGDNKVFITKIAGRDENRYAPFKKKKISDGAVLKYIGLGNAPRTGPIRGEIFDGTREAVNVNTSGKPTIEFRMFRSNVSKAGFFKNLEFVHALVTWCGVGSSANNLDHKEFIKWVSENRAPYEHFYKWLVKNKYLTSKHKDNPEFIERKVLDLETKLVTLKKFPNPGYKAELEDAA